MKDAPKYVAMALHKWSDLCTAETRQPLSLDGTSVGCLLVYDSIEQLQAEQPGARWVKIHPGEDFAVESMDRNPAG